MWWLNVLTHVMLGIGAWLIAKDHASHMSDIINAQRVDVNHANEQRRQLLADFTRVSERLREAEDKLAKYEPKARRKRATPGVKVTVVGNKRRS